MKTATAGHKWEFRARFRRHAFGWRSPPAIKRVNEAVSEIKKVARRDKVMGAEGAVLFLERVSPALEHVDSSSGSIGGAVNRAVIVCAEIIGAAPADTRTRNDWLERLWAAYLEDKMPYIELLGDYWGELCASKETASEWADRILALSDAFHEVEQGAWTYFEGTVNCLSALLAAERYEEVLQLVEMQSHPMWHYRKYGVKALVGMGRKAEALRYAEQSRGLNDNPILIARACEEILLSSGFADEAYKRYGLKANRAGTYLAWFRAVAKKYPHKAPREILHDLTQETPGDEGKWFAAAKSAGLFDEAVELARHSPCSPQTLTRAARDFGEKNPAFAIEAGMTALQWLLRGYGYDVTALDVHQAYSYTMKAAENAGRKDESLARVREMVGNARCETSSAGGILKARLSYPLDSAFTQARDRVSWVQPSSTDAARRGAVHGSPIRPQVDGSDTLEGEPLL